MKIEMKQIYKSFGANQVLKGVDFSVGEGEICALLGENGAGKSTLMNILGGVLNADTGSILLDGKDTVFRTPADSLDSGIAFIHQELNLINDLAVYENMFIGRELKKRGFLDKKEMIRRTEEVFEKIGLELDTEVLVGSLDASYKQFVEIARALMMNASVIIMDEPTTSLTDPEIRRVFEMMKVLKKQGVGTVFISHKLHEVMEICTRYTILRDGNVVASGEVKDTTPEELARHMVGHEVRTESLRKERKISGEEVLRIEHLSDPVHFHDISMTLRKGEILGVTGLLGDGRSELFQAVFGDLPHYTGSVAVEGREVRMDSTTRALDLGIAYVPRNRKENGIVKDMTILENGTLVSLKRLERRGIIDSRKQREEFRIQKDNLRIKMEREEDLIVSLSGGNQQKVVLAKWLSSSPKVLIMDNPTQGVDVGAKEEIYDIILALADQGVGIIILSSEAQEVIRICDRIHVMYHGAIAGTVEGEDMNEHQIMYLAAGGNR